MSVPGANPLLHPPPLLDQLLRTVARRYRLPAILQAPAHATTPMAALAVALEQARSALERGQAPGEDVRQRFLDALALLVREALREVGGDPVYQATVLARRAPQVQEYLALQTHSEGDHRTVRAGVNGVAHPARRQHSAPGPQQEGLALLHAQATSAQWAALAGTARHLIADPAAGPLLHSALVRLLEGPALARLQRATLLESDAQVQAYQSLRDRQGPRQGSPEALAYGSTAQQRGAAMEALATRALEALARRLDAAQGTAGAFRVVTSMRVPASLPGSAERAKSEWDAVLLRQAPAVDGAQPTWDPCLLLEAKASVDAATTDFARLQRGLRLLTQARQDAVYAFATRQGEVLLRGAALSALPLHGDGLARTVVYCTDAPAPATPHLLSAASRMQLLSAPDSLRFADALAQGHPASAQDLAPVWQALLASPQWEAVLHQYTALRRVRDLMLHVDDLAEAVAG